MKLEAAFWVLVALDGVFILGLFTGLFTGLCSAN